MPTKAVFLDTNGWLALLSSADALHFAAKACWSDLVKGGSSFLLTEWIVAETGVRSDSEVLRNDFGVLGSHSEVRDSRG
jgi:predicted nucleic acid-binding protein